MAAIHFIGGEKGGVGKSVLARVVAQFLIDRGIPFYGYDSDRSHGSFRRFYADFAAPVVLDSFASADRIVEAMVEDPSRHAVVDLAAQSLLPLTAWAEASGLAEVLAEGGHRATCWHVLDDTVDSLGTLDDLLAAFGPAVDYAVVLNHGRGSTFAHFAGSAQRSRALDLQARIIELPRLHEASMRKIDQANASFWAAINGTCGLGLLERQRVKVWLRRTYQEIEPILAPAAAAPAA